MEVDMRSTENLYSKIEQDTLIKMFLNKQGYDSIARKLGKSRNSVCGKVSRLREAGVLMPLVKKAPTLEPKTKLKVERRAAPAIFPKPIIQPIRWISKPYPVEPPVEGAIMLIDTKENQCRFPRSIYPSDKMYVCGKPTLPGKSWCQEHAKLVWNPPQARVRR